MFMALSCFFAIIKEVPLILKRDMASLVEEDEVAGGANEQMSMQSRVIQSGKCGSLPFNDY